MTETPKRIQRRRTKGWRMPPNTVYVGRPSKWGNPFKVGVVSAYAGGRKIQDLRYAYSIYRAVAPENAMLVAEAQRELKGKNLACWCPLDGPCHADVLLEIANERV
ncbi:hypothetical protein LCGC14_3128570 [marine sediment metagenome]|uniref:DUF4326 domain-containing protein n=1 Tax=marine sediment metagenome TaxID=412755 RepID=A0A0F8Y7F6_9ZZZZ